MRNLRLLGVVLTLAGAISACSTAPQQRPAAKPSMKDVVFLTREGCVNTATMRTNFEEALKALQLPNDYQFVDADTLKESDPRGGYGSPTILIANRDLFEMPEPPVPHPPPLDGCTRAEFRPQTQFERR